MRRIGHCSEHELQQWVESRGIKTQAIRIVRDLVSGASPAFGYVELKNGNVVGEVVVALNGKAMRGHTILVREAPILLPPLSSATPRKMEIALRIDCPC
jgi:RNA recognition motif